MWATWELHAFRHTFKRSRIRRRDGSNTVTGDTNEVLSLTRQMAEHLRNDDVIRVEAWSCGEVENLDDNWLQVVFRIRRHPNGHDWLADENELHHGGWYRELRPAIDYAFFRGCRKICAIHVLEKGDKVERVILADQTLWDATPVIPPSVHGEFRSFTQA